jgi:hypothetical protein
MMRARGGSDVLFFSTSEMEVLVTRRGVSLPSLRATRSAIALA